jgi:signal transduction histidine kinase
MAKKLFVSNEPLYVEHFNSLFEELWKNGIDLKDRIREIEEGIAPIKTRILYDQDEIIKEIKRKNNSANRLSICTGFGGIKMSYHYLFDSYKSVVDKHQREGGKEGEGLRWITNINEESLNLVKIFLDSGIKIRHIKNMPPISFGVSDKEVAITIEKMEGGKMSQSFLISNDPLYTIHFNSVFEELWKNGVDANDRIKDIEAGTNLADIEVIPNASKARELYFQILKAATEEILLLFPTVNAFIRQEKIVQGSLLLSNTEKSRKKIKFRILMPFKQQIEPMITNFKQSFSDNIQIEIRYIESVMLTTQATILVTDRKKSMVMEIKDDSKMNFEEAIGLSTYSNSKAGVLSYVSIFENLWKQIELYENVKKSHEQLMVHNKAQQEFINIAAHELRTPIQPILGLTEIIRSRTIDTRQQELLDITIRNAKRLSKLSAEILDVTKLESHTLELKKEVFNLNDVIANTIDDTVLSKEFSNKSNQLSYEPCNVLLHADKPRIAEVLSNLLSNAIKFTTDGKITINVERQNYGANNSNKNNNKKLVIVSVKDTGQGIDASMLPRLFTKFASKSYRGTGLGLFISKGIIEAHHGRIWGKNNDNGIGATFSFILPAI